MKRPSNALEGLVDEIVNEAKSKDMNGEPLYPFMGDPLVLGLFGAPEALLGVLSERPLTILSLLQTNKALETFWNQFEDVWPTLIDALIKKAWPMADSDKIYPFFAITNQRIEERTRELFRFQTNTKPTSFLKANRYQARKLLLPGTTVGKRPNNPGTSYAIVYYDPVTKTLVEIYQRILALNDFFKQPEDLVERESVFTALYGKIPSDRLEEFIDEYLRHIDLYYFSTQYILCLNDGFLIDSDVAVRLVNNGGLNCDFQYLRKIHDYLSERYSVYGHGPLLTEEVEITKANEKVGLFPLRVAKSLSKVINLIATLDYMLRNDDTELEECERTMPIPVDANMALPYRDLLYHPIQGLYNTQEKQKAFFLALLTTLSDLSSKEDVIQQFGDIVVGPFACTICANQTYMVDPLSKRAFCNIVCFSHYNNDTQ